MSNQPGLSLEGYAAAAAWSYKDGRPNKMLAFRTMKSLEAHGLAQKKHRGWALTKAGKRAAEAVGIAIVAEIPF